MIRMLILVLALGSSLTSPLFAGCERADRLAPPGAPGFGFVIPGAQGAQASLDFSDFYSLVSIVGDAAQGAGPYKPGDAILFPENGVSNGVITRIDSSSFLLPAIGTYLVQFQVSIVETGALMLSLNGVPIPNSIAGRDGGTTQIVGMSLVATTSPNSILRVISSPGNINLPGAYLFIDPLLGFPLQPISAHLVIVRIG